jgi:AbrB family looped-hinge helix DNA binding protein
MPKELDMLVKIGPRGQITIPKSLRKSLGIKPGDSVTIVQKGDELALRPVTETIFHLRGGIQVTHPQDFEELRERAKQHVANKVLEALTDGE